MTVYIGVDFHPYEQTVAYVDDRDGEIVYRRFLHSDKQMLKAFYRKCGTDACVGVEATGCLLWFEKLLFDNGTALKIGDPRMIRRAALSRHKNDFRDAETILDLLMRGQFPAIVPRSEKSREILDLLHYRQSLVQKRTSVANQLQALARQKGMSKFRLPAAKARKKLLEMPDTDTETFLLSSRFLLFDELTTQIKALEARLEKKAEEDERVKLLMTHPGIGPITVIRRSDSSIPRLAAEEAAPKQKWRRHANSSLTATSCFVTRSVTRSSPGGAKLVCARCQES